MNTVKTMLGLCAVLTLGLMPLQAVAQSGSPARERGEVVICRGVEAHTCGPMVKVGQEAPDFRAVNAALEEVSLSSYRGKRLILNIFPSLDTPTCALSVRQFNARASKLENTVVLCLSMDLPFAQSRFCTTGLMARAVVVIDEDGRVIYTQLVKTISDEPDYEVALKALQ